MKEELTQLFDELLKEYEDAQYTVINDRGSLEDYYWLEETIEEYRNRFENIIGDIN